jgi:glycosyltransferase involved in cell wall biosynthesis
MSEGKPQPVLCAIDAQLSPKTPGGTETHTTLQIDALARHSDERFLIIGLKDQAAELQPYMGPNMELLAYPLNYAWFKPGVHDRFNPSPGLRRLLSVSGPFRGLVREQIRRKSQVKTLSAAETDALLKPYAPKVVHFPYPAHFETRLPFVYEPWGLPHYHFPELYSDEERAWMDALFRDGCEKAAVVIVATRWVKQDVMARHGLPSSKIAVLPRNPVFDDPTKTNGPDDAVGDVPERFALFPGVTWPTKNHLGLLRGMARLRDEHGIRMNLVCTGRTVKPTWPLIEQEILKLGLGDQVRFLGRISRTRLNRLFARAEFLVHPSKFEGLGLPIVEALHFGLPIVASDAACIPEVLGDAAIYFKPDKPSSIAFALKRAMTEPQLLAKMKRRGQKQLKAYFPTHEELAASFVAVYRHAARLPMGEEDRALIAKMTA